MKNFTYISEMSCVHSRDITYLLNDIYKESHRSFRISTIVINAAVLKNVYRRDKDHILYQHGDLNYRDTLLICIFVLSFNHMYMTTVIF